MCLHPRCLDAVREGGGIEALTTCLLLPGYPLTAVVFAIDSIPCTLGITSDPFLALSSNMLAILGLRALYVLLAGGLDKIASLRAGLSAMMGFVGLKMMLADVISITPFQSLASIVLILVLTIVVAVFLGKHALGHLKRTPSHQML